MEKNVEEIRRIMLAVTRMDGAYYYFAKKLGIKVNILNLLYALDDGKPHSQKQVCQDWLIPKTTVNTNVKELIEEGYLMLYPGEGTREKIIGLTEKGKVYTEKILKVVYEAEETAMASVLEKYSPEFLDAVDYFADRLCSEYDKRLSEKTEEEA